MRNPNFDSKNLSHIFEFFLQNIQKIFDIFQENHNFISIFFFDLKQLIK